MKFQVAVSRSIVEVMFDSEAEINILLYSVTLKHDRVVLQFEDFKSERQNLCEKVSALSVRILQMKSKIVRFAERDLCCDDTESSESEKKALLKKQLMKASESERSEEQKY